VTGEPQPQIDIHKDVSRLFFCFLLFFSSFDETMTELGLDATGLTETVFISTWDIFVLFLFWGFFFVFCFFPL
jgi:hypothetical protein